MSASDATACLPVSRRRLGAEFSPKDTSDQLPETRRKTALPSDVTGAKYFGSADTSATVVAASSASLVQVKSPEFPFPASAPPLRLPLRMWPAQHRSVVRYCRAVEYVKRCAAVLLLQGSKRLASCASSHKSLTPSARNQGRCSFLISDLGSPISFSISFFFFLVARSSQRCRRLRFSVPKPICQYSPFPVSPRCGRRYTSLSGLLPPSAIPFLEESWWHRPSCMKPWPRQCVLRTAF